MLVTQKDADQFIALIRNSSSPALRCALLVLPLILRNVNNIRWDEVIARFVSCMIENRPQDTRLLDCVIQLWRDFYELGPMPAIEKFLNCIDSQIPTPPPEDERPEYLPANGRRC